MYPPRNLYSYIVIIEQLSVFFKSISASKVVLKRHFDPKQTGPRDTLRFVTTVYITYRVSPIYLHTCKLWTTVDLALFSFNFAALVR